MYKSYRHHQRYRVVSFTHYMQFLPLCHDDRRYIRRHKPTGKIRTVTLPWRASTIEPWL